MTIKELQELVNKEKTIFVAEDKMVYKIRTSNKYSVVSAGLDDGSHLIPFNFKNVYNNLDDALRAYRNKIIYSNITLIDLKGE